MDIFDPIRPINLVDKDLWPRYVTKLDILQLKKWTYSCSLVDKLCNSGAVSKYLQEGRCYSYTLHSAKGKKMLTFSCKYDFMRYYLLILIYCILFHNNKPSTVF